MVKFIKKMFNEGIFVSAYLIQHQSSLSQFKDVSSFFMFILDTTCNNSQAIIIQANKTQLLNPPNRWLLLTNKTSHVSKLKNISTDKIRNDLFYRDKTINFTDLLVLNNWMILLNSLNIHVGTQVLLGILEKDKNFILIDAYKRNKTLDLDFNIVAYWNKSIGITWNTDFVVARRRQNLQGIPMRVAAVLTNNNTLDHMTDLVNIHIDSMTRVTHFLVTHANEQMNTSLQKFYVSSWGYLVNGTWDGMIGHLIRDEADIGGTGTVLVPERTGVIQYLMMTTPTRLGFVFRQPPLSYTSNVFTLPFSTGVWVSMVAILTLCGFLLYFAFQWESVPQLYSPNEISEEDKQNIKVKHRVTWSDTVMFIIGAVTEQGSTLELNKFSGRIITIFLFIFVMFMITSYAASIVVILQSSTTSIQTLKDLLDSGMELAADDTVYNRYFIKSAASYDPLRRAVYENKIAPKGSPPKFFKLSNGMDRVKKERFAFHVELGPGFKVITETYLEHEKCGLKTITYLPIIDTYTVIQKNSSYKEIISIVYHKMLERGIQRRAYNRYYTKMPRCTVKGSTFVEVGLNEFYPVLIILLCGISCSLVILTFELLSYKKLGKL